MTRPAWYPLTDTDGRAIAESFRSLSADQVSRWIQVVLAGEDSFVAAARDSSPWNYLKEVYHSLDSISREVFRDSLIILLERLLTDGPDHLEDAAPLEYFFLLIGSVFRFPYPSTAPVSLLRTLGEKFVGQADPAGKIAWRALQALVALKYRGDSLFWEKLYTKGGSSFLGLTFSGLCLRDVQEGFDWLAEHGREPGVLAALFFRLPLLIQENGVALISRLLDKLGRHLSKQDTEELAYYAAQLKLRLAGDLRPSPFYEWLSEEVRVFADYLDPEMSQRHPSLARQIEALESLVAELHPVPESLKNPSWAIRVLFGLSSSIARARDLPQALLSKVLFELDDYITNAAKSASAMELRQQRLILLDRRFVLFGSDVLIAPPEIDRAGHSPSMFS